MTVVVVAEPEEVKLVPLAYRGCPIIIAGVGEKMIDTMRELNIAQAADKVVNVGYCGSLAPIGRTFNSDKDNIVIETMDEFVDNLVFIETGEETIVVDMEFDRLKKYLDGTNTELVAIKTVSDNFNYKQYKETTDND